MGTPSDTPSDRTVTFTSNVVQYLRSVVRLAVFGSTEITAREEMDLTWAEMSREEQLQASLVSQLLLADYL